MTYADDLKDAILECEMYNRVSALTEQIMQDIAYEYEIEYETLYNHYYNLYD
jgi:hypothetical protein